MSTHAGVVGFAGLIIPDESHSEFCFKLYWSAPNSSARTSKKSRFLACLLPRGAARRG